MPGRVERELSDELRFHFENQVEEKIADEMTPEDARYAACASWAAWSKSKRSVGICDE
jgi:hypothetical protein